MSAARLSCALLVVLCWACGPDPARARAGEFLVVASVPPLAGLLAELLGDDGRVSCLVPPGADAHVFEPSPARIVELQSARLLVVVGHPSFAFEAQWLPVLAADLPALPVLRLLDGAVQGAGRGAEDPHLWLAPSELLGVVARLEQAVVGLDPARAPAIAARARALSARIGALRDTLRSAATGAPPGFVAMHGAWGRLAAELGLTQFALPPGHAEPGPYDLARLIDQARAASVRLVIVPPWMDGSAADLVAQELGARVVALDHLAADVPATLGALADALAGTGRAP